jgi:uncharacterized SAM-binding protein YcdF (DUF218 family)
MISGALRIAGILCLLYTIGFAVFCLNLPRPARSAAVAPKSDAIVALTGEGSRLAPAVALLERGNGQRLLITGVNRATSKRQLRALLKGGTTFDCCADLGFEAADTRGNAREAAAWAKAHHYQSLTVVTADYHMPRSLLEFGAAMPRMRLIPFAVATDPPKGSLLQKATRLNGEYDKFLASWAEHVFLPNETPA